MTTGHELRFELPVQDLHNLTFCKTEPTAIQEWIDNLPIANLGECARMLYSAIGELNRLNVSPQARYDALERIRPVIYFINRSLKKYYLNQPIILPPQAQKVALLSFHLQHELALGYGIIIAQSEGKMGGLHLKKPTQIMVQAIHRAISDHSLNLVRSFQLYEAVSEGLWFCIHQYYQLAKQFDLLDHSVDDLQVSPAHSSTIRDIYLRALLLGCIRANQLRQEDVELIFSKMGRWVNKVRLTPVKQKISGAFIIDPQLDNPPIYQKFYRGNFNPQCHCLNTAQLVEQLREDLVSGGSDISANLLNHLIIAWGALTDRTFMRLEARDQLDICIGLSTTHYFVSNNMTFDDLVLGPDKVVAQGKLSIVDEKGNPDAWRDITRHSEQVDTWGQIFKMDDQSAATSISLESIDYHVQTSSDMPAGGGSRDKFQDFKVQMVNMSPGGYCLSWPDDAPRSLKTGEIIGIKETQHSTWSIGAIRWISQENKLSIQLGVELLSPTATPYGARIIHKTGSATSQFMRVLLLPEIKPMAQEKSIITPAVSFKVGQKVLIVQNGIESTILLTRLLNSTHSYCQFEYELSKQRSRARLEELSRHLDDEEFDSLWKTL